MPLPNLVVSGPMRSGKDSVAEYLSEKHGYIRATFARALKEEVAKGVGCAVSDLDVEPLRSQIRPVLQVWGTEFRRAQDPEYWLKKMASCLDGLTRGVRGELQVGGYPIIVTDARFLNELEMLAGYGFIPIQLDMSYADVGSYLMQQGKSGDEIVKMLDHESENAWRPYPFDYKLDSIRGELASLFEDIEEVILKETQP